MRPQAELIPDRGAVAETGDFFRSRAFYDAEGVTHSLRISADGGAVAIPVIARGIPGSQLIDAISPYGYPGAAVEGGVRPDPAEVDWSGTGLVSVFLRERLGPEPFMTGATERSRVQVADPGGERKSRMSDRQQIRRNERDGYRVERLSGPETDEDQRRAYGEIYDQTMDRLEAEERYRYGAEYWDLALSSDNAWLFVVHAPDSGYAAGAVAVLSDRILHYYLSGTADAHLRASPAKNLIAAVIDFAERLGVPMNLGGGVRPGDSLEAFKRGFANAELPFYTHEVVCDPAGYEELSAGREDTGFFPLYRSATG